MNVRYGGTPKYEFLGFNYGASRTYVRVARIELAPSAWKANVLPLNYTRIFMLHGCASGFKFLSYIPS